MKVLLVINNWWPWNNSGAFRWAHIGEYMDFDVLTSNKPMGSIYDETMPGKEKRIFYRGFYNVPAVLGGVCLAFFSLFNRKGYDYIIFTSPPDPLIIGAWMMQLFTKNVVLDVRDDFYSSRCKANPFWFLYPIWQFFFKRIKNKVAVNEVIPECGNIIRHGHMDLNLSVDIDHWEFVEYKRYKYAEFKNLLEHGKIPDYRMKNPAYTPQTYYTYRKYFVGLPKHFKDKRMYEWPIESYREIAEKWKNYLKGLK